MGFLQGPGSPSLPFVSLSTELAAPPHDSLSTMNAWTPLNSHMLLGQGVPVGTRALENCIAFRADHIQGASSPLLGTSPEAGR